MVRFQHVGMRYGLGEEVLRDVSFELGPGSFHFLTGPSGAGKTTLLRLMYLAHRPTRGLMTMFGQDVTTAPRRALPPLRRRIAPPRRWYSDAQRGADPGSSAAGLRAHMLRVLRLRYPLVDILRHRGIQ